MTPPVSDIPEGFTRGSPFTSSDETIPKGFTRGSPFGKGKKISLAPLSLVPPPPAPLTIPPDTSVVAPAATTGVFIDMPEEEKAALGIPKPVYETVYKKRRYSSFGIDVLGKPETVPFQVETEESKATRKKFIFDLTGRTTELPPLEYETVRVPTGTIKGEQQFENRQVATLDSRYNRAIADIGRPLTLDEMEEIGGGETFLNNVGVGLRALKNLPAIIQVGLRDSPGELIKAVALAAPEAAFRAAALAIGGPIDRREALDFFTQDPFAVLDIAAGVGMALLPLKITSAAAMGAKAAKGALFANKAAEVAFEASRGIRKTTLLQHTKDVAQSAWQGITREFSSLPNKPQFERFRFDLQNLKKQRGITSDKAIDNIDKIVKGFTKEDSKLFSYKVTMDDIFEQRKLDPKSSLVYWGDDLDSFMIDYNTINTKAKNSPIVSKALVKRKEMWDNFKPAYIQALEDVGFDVGSRLTRENYFHRMIIEQSRTKTNPGGGIKTPTSRSFLKSRTGSSKLFNTDYIQAEFNVLSQMKYDMEVASLIKSIDNNYNIGGKIADAPKGYVQWQPREGNYFFTAETLPHRIVEDIHVSKMQELLEGVKVKGVRVTADDLREVLAVGRRRKTFIIPEEIRNTIEEVGRKNTKQGAFAAFTKGSLKTWKAWTLLSPRRFIKYNIRNLTGDMDFVFLGNTSGFKMTPRATKELFDYFKNRKTTPELQEWIDRGGLGSTLQVQELGDLNGLDRFSKLALDKPNIVTRVAKGYWRKVRISTDMREGVLRYANYLDYKKQMGLNPDGRPHNFGASVRENVMSLDNVGDRAFVLSNDLLGAYDRVSVAGQFLREHIYPFWSWKEVNLKRYIQAAKNATQDGVLSMTVGKSLAGKALRSPYMALQLGRFATKAVAMQAVQHGWNNFVMGDLEWDLPNSLRGTSHIVLGTDKDGNIMYFSRLGAFADAQEWFGLDKLPQYYDRISKGQMTYKQMAREMVNSPVNVLAQGIRPDIKTAAELFARQSAFPDVFKGRRIRDNMEHVARVFGLQNEYRALTGKPGKDYLKTFADLAVYRINPNESAYRNLWDSRIKYLDSIGKGGIGFWESNKGNALYNMKQSLRYKDPIAFTHYLGDYFENEGTTQGVASSISGMHPLSNMSESTRIGFVEWLGEDAEKIISQANQYFSDVINVDDDFLNKVEDILKTRQTDKAPKELNR